MRPSGVISARLRRCRNGSSLWYASRPGGLDARTARPASPSVELECHHAAAVRCVSTAAILRQPSILRNLICPLATKLKRQDQCRVVTRQQPLASSRGVRTLRGAARPLPSPAYCPAVRHASTIDQSQRASSTTVATVSAAPG